MLAGWQTQTQYCVHCILPHGVTSGSAQGSHKRHSRKDYTLMLGDHATHQSPGCVQQCWQGGHESHSSTNAHTSQSHPDQPVHLGAQKWLRIGKCSLSVLVAGQLCSLRITPHSVVPLPSLPSCTHICRCLELCSRPIAAGPCRRPAI